MNVRVTPIGESVEPVQTWNPATRPDDMLSYVDLSAIDQLEKRITNANRIRGVDAPSRARQVIRAGDVLISTVRPNLNGVAPVTEEFDGATASTGFCVLRPSADKLDSRYLVHWVRSPKFIAGMVREATGASYPAVSDRIVKASPIPLPSLVEQRRIAAILDKADALRRDRKRALDLLDSLTQSIFLEMFGDGTRWNMIYPLGELSQIVSGITKGRKLTEENVRSIGYLAVANVQDKKLDLSAVKTIDATEAEISRYRLRRDDLLLTEGGDPDKLGRGTLWNDEIDEVIHQNHIFRVRVRSDDLLPLYLMWLVGSAYGRSYFLKSAKQTTGIASINKQQLSSFPVPIPPLKLQKSFAVALEKIRHFLNEAMKARAIADELFASLQYRAFSGQL